LDRVVHFGEAQYEKEKQDPTGKLPASKKNTDNEGYRITVRLSHFRRSGTRGSRKQIEYTGLHWEKSMGGVAMLFTVQQDHRKVRAYIKSA